MVSRRFLAFNFVKKLGILNILLLYGKYILISYFCTLQIHLLLLFCNSF